MRTNHSSMIDIIFTLALLGVFAASALGVTLIGATVYKHITADMEENFNSRTAVSYLVQKVRQHDSKDSVSIESYQGTETLVLNKSYGNVETKTYIYYYNGKIMELNLISNLDGKLSDGQAIVEANGFKIKKISQGLYLIQFETINGKLEKVYVYSHSNGGRDEV